MRILGICGSLQAQSANLTLLRSAVASAPEGVEVGIFDGLRDLPLFNPDLEAAGQEPPAVGVWRRALSESDALLIVCPEYGFSLPGALKKKHPGTVSGRPSVQATSSGHGSRRSTGAMSIDSLHFMRPTPPITRSRRRPSKAERRSERCLPMASPRPR
jgi:hypothetical protein